MRELIPQPKGASSARTRGHSRWSQISALIRTFSADYFSCFLVQKITCKVLKEQLMAKAVNPKHYQVDPDNAQWTKPGTWGTYIIPDEFVYGRKRKYRYGNYPVRMKELERDYGSVKLEALFENRDDAKSLADLLENE